ncbi:death-associated protein 1 isoform X1 [Monodelphis domestica]|uniref:death-associated protein 1 isoform X1 n=1 Tax=Monodelphis domestica TaxID=13616 RepID=UPI0024E1CF93|nr:death-associated protein 1 isoform X1 [Monodelphis domestica]
MSSPTDEKVETRAGHPPAAHLNQLCTSLVLLQGVTKTSPLRQLKWPTRNLIPPWKSTLPGQRSTSSSPASEGLPQSCQAGPPRKTGFLLDFTFIKQQETVQFFSCLVL